jgi:hypothetical protein
MRKPCNHELNVHPLKNKEMKSSHSLNAFLQKAFPIFTFIVVVFFGFTNCAAQSVVGKWKQVSGKNYFTAEAVKKSHGHLQDVMEMSKVDAIDDFRADNTLIETITSGGTKTTTTCSWTQSGNKVKISIKGQETLSGIVSNNGTTLVLSVETPVSKREWTYSKI